MNGSAETKKAKASSEQSDRKEFLNYIGPSEIARKFLYRCKNYDEAELSKPFSDIINHGMFLKNQMLAYFFLLL